LISILAFSAAKFTMSAGVSEVAPTPVICGLLPKFTATANVPSFFLLSASYFRAKSAGKMFFTPAPCQAESCYEQIDKSGFRGHAKNSFIA